MYSTSVRQSSSRNHLNSAKTLASKTKMLTTACNRIVHRHKTLKDEDFVPDDTVNLGEQDLAEDVLAENGPALSYLWVVDGSTLESRSSASSPASTAGVSKEKLVKTKSPGKSQSMTGTETLVRSQIVGCADNGCSPPPPPGDIF